MSNDPEDRIIARMKARVIELDGQTLKEGAKKDEGKPRWDLLAWDAVEQEVLVLNFGCKKYADRNWELGIKYSRVYGAAIRHLWTWFFAKMLGQDGRDSETGLSHLAHASCCIRFLLAYELRGMTQFDDRPSKGETGK